MSEKGRFDSKRSRTVLGLVVVAISLAFAVTLAGMSFASSSSTSAAQYQYGKLTICHHTHSKKHPTVTIVVNEHAWPAHKKHGDTQGPCPTSPPGSKEKEHSGNPSTPSQGQNDQGEHGKPSDTPGNGHGHGHGHGHGK